MANWNWFRTENTGVGARRCFEEGLGSDEKGDGELFEHIVNKILEESPDVLHHLVIGSFTAAQNWASALQLLQQRQQPLTRNAPGVGNAHGHRCNLLYKSALCFHFLRRGTCPKGEACKFAHGIFELRLPQNHPKYRTRLCVHYTLTGACPFGEGCFFVHRYNPPSTPESPDYASLNYCI
uniref:C3H1-type domain-containing protein n=1 Tax=Mesocestoides corti TaxID=53468 RepID=A0A5K3FXG7_MESCO